MLFGTKTIIDPEQIFRTDKEHLIKMSSEGGQGGSGDGKPEAPVMPAPEPGAWLASGQPKSEKPKGGSK